MDQIQTEITISLFPLRPITTNIQKMLRTEGFSSTWRNDHEVYINIDGHIISLFEGDHGFLNRDNYFETLQELQSCLDNKVKGRIYNGRSYQNKETGKYV